MILGAKPETLFFRAVNHSQSARNDRTRSLGSPCVRVHDDTGTDCAAEYTDI